MQNLLLTSCVKSFPCTKNKSGEMTCLPQILRLTFPATHVWARSVAVQLEVLAFEDIQKAKDMVDVSVRMQHELKRVILYGYCMHLWRICWKGFTNHFCGQRQKNTTSTGGGRRWSCEADIDKKKSEISALQQELKTLKALNATSDGVMGRWWCCGHRQVNVEICLIALIAWTSG